MFHKGKGTTFSENGKTGQKKGKKSAEQKQGNFTIFDKGTLMRSTTSRIKGLQYAEFLEKSIGGHSGN